MPVNNSPTTSGDASRVASRAAALERAHQELPPATYDTTRGTVS